VTLDGTKKSQRELTETLTYLVGSEEDDHVHLFSPALGGSDLTEVKVPEDGQLVHHLKISCFRELPDNYKKLLGL